MTNPGEMIGLGFLILIIYGVVSLIPCVLAIIDILGLKKSTKYKIVWLTICLTLGIFGVLIYFFVEKKLRR